MNEEKLKDNFNLHLLNVFNSLDHWRGGYMDTSFQKES